MQTSARPQPDPGQTSAGSSETSARPRLNVSQTSARPQLDLSQTSARSQPDLSQTSEIYNGTQSKQKSDCFFADRDMVTKSNNMTSSWIQDGLQRLIYVASRQRLLAKPRQGYKDGFGATGKPRNESWQSVRDEGCYGGILRNSRLYLQTLTEACTQQRMPVWPRLIRLDCLFASRPGGLRSIARCRNGLERVRPSTYQKACQCNCEHGAHIDHERDKGSRREVCKFNKTSTGLNFMHNKHRNQTAVAENTGHA